VFFQQYNRSTTFKTNFLSVSTINPPNSEIDMFDGYLGLQPYTANSGREDFNFMKQLKTNGLIDHITFSFYIKAAQGNSSIIKFGSYDEQGIATDATLAVYKTKEVSSWKIIARNLRLNGHYITTQDSNRDFLFDMSLPYMYLPQKDWLNFAKYMAVFNLDLHCSDFANSCKFNKPCSETNINTWYFSMDLADGQSANTYSFPSNNNFLIPGDVFGDSSDTCYIPVFKSTLDDNTVYYGNIWMNYFYVVFDMSPLDEHNQDYITVGVAPINPEHIVGQEQYNPPTPTPSGGGGDVPPPPPPPANDSSSHDNSTIPIPDPGNDTKPVEPTNNTQGGGVSPSPSVTPVGPNDDTSANNGFMAKYGLYVIIGGVALLVLVAIMVWCCCLKKSEKDPYFDKRYSVIEEDAPLKGSLGIQ